MSLNFANGVEFWSTKDNTPQNGNKLTDAQGNELTFGGGGGDFSTATVTLNFNGANPQEVYGAIKRERGNYSSSIPKLAEGNNEVILYKNAAGLIFPDGLTGATIDGSYQQVSDYDLIVTGDCTITW